MKKTITSILFVLIALNFSACKKEEKKKEITATQYTVNKYNTAINWTAFKTTDKVPVKGKFTTLNITKTKSGATLTEALNGVEFSIPVSSIFSNNPSRDSKLQNLFFGVMKNTELLSGTIHLTDKTSGYVDFSMNGVIEKLNFTYTTGEKTIEIKSIMNLDTWQAQAAVASLNEACFELHKGADGVSKTWNEVAIDITVHFSKK